MADLTSSQKYYRRNRQRILARLREKYASDMAFRDAVKKRSRDRYHNDEKYRKATIERARKRYKRRKRS